MKHIRKLLAVLLAAMMLAPAALALAADGADPTRLQFNENGEFKIMLFADPQDDQNLEETTVAIMCEALDKYQPDLVIYLGDNAVADAEFQPDAIKAVAAGDMSLTVKQDAAKSAETILSILQKILSSGQTTDDEKVPFIPITRDNVSQYQQ